MLEKLLSALEIGKCQYGNYAALSRASGVSEANISRWRKGAQTPRLVDFAPLLEAVSAQIVFPGQEVLSYSQPMQFSSPRVEEADEAEPSAVPDLIRQKWHADQPDILFLPALMKSFGLAKENALLFRIEGEGMAPLLHQGDHALVDTSKCRLGLEQGIYLLFSNGAFMVRRLYRTPDHIVLVDEQTRAEQRIDPAYVTVLGRVVWVGKRLV